MSNAKRSSNLVLSYSRVTKLSDLSGTLYLLADLSDNEGDIVLPRLLLLCVLPLITSVLSVRIWLRSVLVVGRYRGSL